MNVQILDLLNPLWTQTLRSLRHDIYQLPEYVSIEAKRINAIPEAILFMEGDQWLFVPYLLRRCDQDLAESSTADLFDVISPYGYSGLLLSEAGATREFLNAALKQFKQVFQNRGICSAFLRLHPILNQAIEAIAEPNTFTLNGQTVSIDLTLTEAELWSHIKPDHRNKIKRCHRLGLTARMVPVQDYLTQFVEIYLETMQRVGATPTYLAFNQHYFSQLLDALGEMLHLCIVEFENEVTAAGLYSECGGIVQSLFGGTRTKFFKLSPSNLQTDHVRRWAKERGNDCLHLGGGLGASHDHLYTFKAGFSKQRHDFLTLRLIVDQTQYMGLVTQQSKALGVQPDFLLQTGFFPAYRSPISS
jgi:Acetyltransferase (GNAT) domain